MNAPIALAITAGMVAAINPCGFSLLPAYVSLFVGSSSRDTSVEKRLLRAVASALTVTAGFVAVFATTGLIIDRASDGIQQRLPFITIAVGTLIFFAGMAVFFGRRLALPALVKAAKNETVPSCLCWVSEPLTRFHRSLAPLARSWLLPPSVAEDRWSLGSLRTDRTR